MLHRNGAETLPISKSQPPGVVSRRCRRAMGGHLERDRWLLVLTPAGTTPMLHKRMLTSVDPVSPGLGYRWGGKLHSVCAGLAHAL